MSEDFDLIGFLENEVDRRQGAGEAYHAEAEAALAEAQRWLRRLDALERAEDSLGRVYDVPLIPEAE